MSFRQSENIKYFVFDSLVDEPVIQAIFTRRGGVSPSPWATLNLGATVGDEFSRVIENRKRAFSAIGCSYDSVFDVWQVHSAEVVCTDKPKSPQTPHLQADVIITDRPGVTLLMRFADCVPIFLYDPKRRVVGLAHAGWQGTVLKTVQAAVKTMQAQYQCHPADILAGIGPSIAKHHYQVGEDVISKVEMAFGKDSNFILSHQDGAVQLDLWEANRLILAEAGIRYIEVAGICTACQLDDWFSHRGENGKTGRFGGLIHLKA